MPGEWWYPEKALDLVRVKFAPGSLQHAASRCRRGMEHRVLSCSRVEATIPTVTPPVLPQASLCEEQHRRRGVDPSPMR